MAKNLLIVESPAKAKTIEKYLGKDFMVKSSYGHIRDLDKGKKGVNIEDGFEPSYVVSPEKKKVVAELKAAKKKVEEVWLATDEDREGEAISWHLCEVLGLDYDTTKRIVFREITKPAIQKAVENPRLVDKHVVNAQQARRILDRLVGFELSEILWRKVKNKLSAGRVQSVAVKLLVERERQIQQFDSKPYFKVNAIFSVFNKQNKPVDLKAELKHRFETAEEALAFLEDCKTAKFSIGDIKVKPAKRTPAAPFTTSTLQQDASRRLGFSVNRTMKSAQRLYEQGNITYMRTDSTSLSQMAIGTIADEVKKQYGEEYSKVRVYKSKDANAQEAHEAIRPTYISNHEVAGDSDMVKLYNLIWKRTIASQMSDAKLEKTSVSIDISTRNDHKLTAEGQVITFDGFLKVYMESKDEDEGEESPTAGVLPPLSINMDLPLNNMDASEKFTRAPARFTEAALVKKLEELGIGRPSTYAPTITKIMEEARGYVTKESREGVERSYRFYQLENQQINKEVRTEITGKTSNRLYPSDLGMLVTDFLSEHFDNVMNYSFTAEVEGDLDAIANGEMEWKTMLTDFYKPFHDTVEDTIENAERAKGRRDLGVDPETGLTLLVQMTRYGPVAQIGSREEVGEEGKPKFANLKVGQSMETISYEEALDLFKLPRTAGEYESKEVVIGAGRYGPYVKFDEKFVSIPRDEDPMEISLERCIELIEAKRKEDAPVTTYKGEPVTQGKGRFGPFLKYKNLYVNIPRRIDPDTITQEQMHELVEAKLVKEANRYIAQWPEEKIALENGRWGPFIRFKKKSVKLPKVDGEKPTAEYLKTLSLDDVKKLIEDELPGSFKKPKAKAKKKAKPKAKPKKK